MKDPRKIEKRVDKMDFSYQLYAELSLVNMRFVSLIHAQRRKAAIKSNLKKSREQSGQ